MTRLFVALIFAMLANLSLAAVISPDAASADISAETVAAIKQQAKQANASANPKIPEPAPAPRFDYSVNQKSDVFGSQLFTGSFANQGPIQFNNDYAISNGDQLQVRFWGGFDFDSLLTVDPKGNIFLPHVGPVNVLGVRNQDLQRVVESAVRKVFRANVFCYASLAAAQPVRVFVGGFVNRPGL